MQRHSSFSLFFQTGAALVVFLVLASLFSWATTPALQAQQPHSSEIGVVQH